MWLSRLVASTLAVLGLVAASTAYAAGGGPTTPIPFPGSLTLLSSGVAALAGVAWWLRRRK